ncbi:heme exporter protein CcmB [Ottowia sp.]|uniref:heme exporter protein CcmB n=1 Tax=Ottowia sp. TaxID=1898956 RepID=UPI003A84F929
MTWPMLRAVFLREWAQAVHCPADLAWHALFFAMVATLFPLSLRPDAVTLQLLAPGVLWVGALLAVLLASGKMFQDDLQHGWIDQWLLACRASGMPLALLVAARLAAQWVLTAVPVLLVAPLLALQFGLAAWPLAVLMLGLALGTGVLVLVTGVAAALAGGLHGAAMLVMLMVLPLVAPALIFGALAVHHAIHGQPVGADLSLLGAMLAAAALICPALAAVGLKAATEI